MSRELLAAAIERLGEWQSSVPMQASRHFWSFLPVKFKGAQPGETISYEEKDDERFLQRFFRVGTDPNRPYFDPTSKTWLPAGYYHSNAATFRSNTFVRAWRAADWDKEEGALTLSADYGTILVEKMLRKAGKVSRLPALPLAVWFFKRPSADWTGHEELAAGPPGSPSDAVALFRTLFHFDNDPAWPVLFDPDVSVLQYSDEGLDS